MYKLREENERFCKMYIEVILEDIDSKITSMYK